MAARIRIRRLARIVVIAAGGVLGLVLLACLLLLVRPVREGLLVRVLQVASDALPGSIEVGETTWPALSRVEIRTVAWREDDAVLASADRIAVDADLGALLRKDLHLRLLVVEGAEADVPLIRGAMPAEPGDGATTGAAFPRAGAIPGVPSLAVDSLSIEVARLQAAEGVTIEARIGLAVDMLAGRAPRVSIRSLEAAWLQKEWSILSPGVDLAFTSGEFTGRIDADFPPRAALRMDFETPAPREFRVVLAERDAAEELLRIDGSFVQSGNGAVESATYSFWINSPGLARIEQALQRPGSLVSLAPLGRVRAQGQGDLEFADAVNGEVGLSITAEGIPARMDARLRHEAGAIEIERLSAEASGFRLVATGSFAGGAYTGTAEADVEGTAFLAGWPAADGIPQDLRAHLELEAGGEGSALSPVLLLTGSARSAGLDSLHVTGNGRIEGAETDLRLELRAFFREKLAVLVGARAVDLDRPRLHVAPVIVRERLDQLPSSPGSLPGEPNVTLDRSARSLAIDDLRATGALGELRLYADLSQAEGGSGRLALEWPEPPAVLNLANFDAAARDSLLAPYWSRDGRPGIDARLRVGAEASSASLDADIVLPAPWSIIAGLEPAAYEAPHLRGAVHAEWQDTGSWQARLDFAATSWLDSAFVHAHGTNGTTRLDSMLVRGGPVRATAMAELDSSRIDGKFQLDLVSHPALSMVVPDFPADLAFMANLRAGITGSPKAPDARAKLLATARGPALQVPLLSIEAEVVEGKPQFARLDVPEAAMIGGLDLARAQVLVRPENPAQSLIPLWFASDVEGEIHWVQTARIDSIGNTWQVATDSLRIGAGGNVLASLRPFLFEVAPADSTIRLEGLEMAGEPGTVSASFDLGPGRAQADVEMHLDATIPSALVRMPPAMLPSGYHLVARGNESDLQASLRVEGIKLGTRRGIVARMDSRRVGDQVEIQIRANDELGRLARGDVVLPMTADLLNRRFAWYDGPLAGSVEVDSLPLPYRIGGGGGVGRYLLGAHDESAPLADASLVFGGTGRQPVVGARIGVGFPQIEELRENRLHLSAIWAGPQADTGSLDLIPREILERMEQSLPHGGIEVLGSLDRGNRRLASVRAAFPLAEGARSPIPGFGPQDPVVFDVSAEPLRLDEWNSILPRGTEVGGQVWLTASGDGPIGDFPIAASLRMEKLFFRQSLGNSATLDGRVDVTGRSSAPVIRGNVNIPSALVRLPESSRNLHPVQGESQLRKLGLERRDAFAALDSLEVEWGWAFSPEDSTESDEPALTIAETTDLDVRIRIPNSFWIQGQGLRVQLAGDLHLELRDGVPIIVGELRALSGTLEVVGARLQLDRGVVTFYGGDTENPSLDLELSRSQGDVRVIVRVTGTALEPRLAFDSDPPMSQSDIMSYLLFGSSASDLDGAQTQLLQDQAAAALSQFAAPMLENELTQSLGISMMQLQAGENPDDGLSLMVGKYVTPQILLKYEQSLKDRQKYTLNAEYWLTRNLRIETRLSETRSTGIGLNWGRDY